MARAILQFVEGFDGDDGTGRAYRVTHRDGTAVWIYDPGVEVEVLVHGMSLCGKGFVALDDVEVTGIEAGFGEEFPDGGDGPMPMTSGRRQVRAWALVCLGCSSVSKGTMSRLMSCSAVTFSAVAPTWPVQKCQAKPAVTGGCHVCTSCAPPVHRRSAAKLILS